MHVLARSSKASKTLIPLLALFLAACATQSVSPTRDNAEATQAEQLVSDGDLGAAAQQFLALADSSGGNASAHYRLRAAEIMRESGAIDLDERVLRWRESGWTPGARRPRGS